MQLYKLDINNFAISKYIRKYLLNIFNALYNKIEFIYFIDYILERIVLRTI